MTREQVVKKRTEALERFRKAKRGEKLRRRGEVYAWTHRLLEMEVRAKRRGA